MYNFVRYQAKLSNILGITENYSVFMNSMFVYLRFLATKLKVINIRLFENKGNRLVILKASLIVPAKFF